MSTTISKSALGLPDRSGFGDSFDEIDRAADLGMVCFSDPSILDLCIYKGDTGTFRVTVAYSDGSAIDVSLATWNAEIRTPDGVLVGDLVVTPVAGQPNQINVSIPSSVSNLLPLPPVIPVWDLEMTLSGQVQTLLAGTVTVTKDVSRPTP